MPADELPRFHPMTVLRDWNEFSSDAVFQLSDAQTGTICFGSTGSGKTSGPAKHWAMAYLAFGFGGVVLCSKKDERPMWEAWAEQAGRWNREKQTGDLIIVDKSGKHRFNFLDWEARRGGDGGVTINIVALLDEIAGAIASGAGQASEGGGDNKFFEDALHLMNLNLVDLCLLAKIPVSLPLMRDIVNTAPQSLKEAQSDEWKRGKGQCAAMLREAEAVMEEADEDTRADFEECRSYWEFGFPGLSERTRSIVTLSFSMLARPLLTRPLRRIFSTDTTVRPEDTFKGKILVIDLPLQELFLAGKIANHIFKFCFQRAVLGRVQPKDSYLRPVVLHADEFANFVTEYDTLWASVCRSAGGVFSVMIQNKESLLRVLKSEAAVDSLLGNLQCQVFCQNSSVQTNAYAAKLIGERWRPITTITSGQSNPQADGADPTMSSGASSSEQRRYYVEPARFATLRKGGPSNDYLVECFVYNGGMKYEGVDEQGHSEQVPYMSMTLNQRR